ARRQAVTGAANPRGRGTAIAESRGAAERARRRGTRTPGVAMTVVLWPAILACVAYLLFVYGVGLLLAVFARFENARRANESAAEAWDTIGRSRFTIPVSVIAPMHNEEVLAVAVVEALLELDYPEFEVIVVDDGSTDATLERLCERFGLRAFEKFERRVLPVGEIDAIYRSGDRRLSLLHKRAGGDKASALNA